MDTVTSKLFDMYRDREYYYGMISSPGAIGLLYTWKNILQKCKFNEHILDVYVSTYRVKNNVCLIC